MLDRPLHALDLTRKLLLTSVLAVLAAGFVAGEACVFHRTGGAGGKPGLSLDGITFTFHGNRGATRLKEEILGPMKRYFSAFEDATSLSAEEQADLERVLAWNDADAPEMEFLRCEQGKTPIYAIFERRGCLSCHASGATTIGNKKDSPLTTYAGIARFTRPDCGMEPDRLLVLSHVHLLGAALIFLFTGAALAATLWPVPVRCALAVGGPLSALIATLAWWAVKYGGAAWAPLVLVGGALMTLCFALSIVGVLYDLWLRRH